MSETGGRDVTVVIPTRNRAELASRAIGCALDQRDVDVRVIVVDDCSDDGAPDVLRSRFGSAVELLEQPVNGGVSRARNRGLERATSTYVSFLDDDDVWSPSKLASQLDQLVADGSEWAFSAVAVVDADLRPIRIDGAQVDATFSRRSLESYLVPAAMTNIVVRTDLARQLGGLDPGYWHNADWDFVARLALRSPPAYDPAPTVGYVLHRKNVSGVPIGKYEDMERFEARFAADRERLGAGSSLVHSLRWIGLTSARFGQREAARAAYLGAFRSTRSLGDLARAGASQLPRYAAVMDLRQRAKAGIGRRADLGWLSSVEQAVNAT